MSLNRMPKGAVFIAWALGLSVMAAAARQAPHVPRSSARSVRVSGAGAAIVLESRITDYWNLRCARDLAGLYEFYSPEYRARISRTQFMGLARLIRLDVRRFRITKATISGSKADVGIVLKVHYPTLSAGEIELHASETWVQERDGRWYKQDEPTTMPFPP